LRNIRSTSYGLPAGAEQIGRDAYTHTTEQLNGLPARKLLRNARGDMGQH
jgi:hypothetical protein